MTENITFESCIIYCFFISLFYFEVLVEAFSDTGNCSCKFF